MGTDIHFYVQKRHPEKPEEWVFMDGPAPSEEFDLQWEKDHGDKDWYKRSWYSSRNYNLFAILANVRNGSGFAGIDTGDGFKTMTSELRGLPEDFMPTKWMLEHDTPEHGHDANWVSLKEVLEFPWKDLETNHRGWVDEHEFKTWLEDGGQGGPKSWCGGISGRGVRHVDIGVMTKIVTGALPREEGEGISYHCQLEWGESYWDSCEFFCETVLPQLEELADGDPSSVRLVFWFDS